MMPDGYELRATSPNDSRLCTKKIAELAQYHFVIKGYQRGYRWKPVQVTQLLEDINTFNPGSEDGEFYCLQPVVVKEIQQEENTSHWELIDGQQRLTTIYLILKQFLGTNEADYYSLTYETRTQSKWFLENIHDISHKFDEWHDLVSSPGNPQHNTIDNFHFFMACEAIEKWKKEKNETIINQFKEKLLHHTRVIWYAASPAPQVSGDIRSQTSNHSPIDIFTRLNAGKIPLTEAELIKAAFINRLADPHSEASYLRQTQLISEWDTIEQQLRKPDFWSFLTAHCPDYQPDNRIELCFRLSSIGATTDHRDDSHNLFYALQKTLREQIIEPEAVCDEGIWREVKNLFGHLKNWYERDELYHHVGFYLLTHPGKAKNPYGELKVLIGKSTQENKNVFQDFVKSEIASRNLHLSQKESRRIDPFDLSYGQDNQVIKNLLLLHNLQVYIENRLRFPFSEFASTSWSLEHINPQNPDTAPDPKLGACWYDEQKFLLNHYSAKPSSEKTESAQNLLALLSTCEQTPTNVNYYTYLSELAKSGFSEAKENLHGIENLALLETSQNISLNNSRFMEKRKRLKMLQKEEFVPLATQQVFSKYFSESVEQMQFWSAVDKDSYKEALVDCFNRWSEETS